MAPPHDSRRGGVDPWRPDDPQSCDEPDLPYMEEVTRPIEADSAPPADDVPDHPSTPARTGGGR